MHYFYVVLVFVYCTCVYIYYIANTNRKRLVAELLRINPEMMLVEMHAMLPPGIVPEPLDRDIAKGQIRKLVVISADNPVEGP